MKRAPKRRARAAPAVVLDEHQKLEPEQTTIHPIPEILWNPERPEEPHHSEREVATIRVSRAVTGNGYSYLGEVVPSDLPTDKELLARFGPGRYRLDGLTTKNTYVKTRVGLCVGDFDQNPAGGVAGYRLPPAPSQAQNVAGLVATVLGILTPIVAPIVAHLKESADRRETMQRDHTTQLLTMMQSIGNARTADLENMLKAALANISNPSGGGGGTGAKAMQETFVNMLDAQRAVYTDLMSEARQTAGDDETLKTLVSAFSGYTEAQKADAQARLEEAKAAQARAAANGAATNGAAPSQEPAHAMAAAH